MNDDYKKLLDNLIGGGYLKTPEIVAAFAAVDRADFVLPEDKWRAYENHALPIGAEQTISQPATVAIMIELLASKAGDKILEIGFGSGWQTTILAKIAGEKGSVSAIERLSELFEFGKANIAEYNFIEKGIVKVYCQDGTLGLPDTAEKIGGFDGVIAAAAGEKIPEAWREQLKIGGRMVLPVKNSVWLVVKKSETEFEEKEFPGFAFVPLVEGS
ncbi:MAG: protein-L-isoaspartate O-methyltransferase [Patescibacteria group bacterium]